MGMVIYLRRASTADIQQVRADPKSVEDFVFEQGEEHIDLIEFDKAWHALHFLLTGEVYGLGHPLGIIADETPTEGTDEQGFGGFTVIEPARMVVFAKALAEIDDATLSARFDPQAMVDADIYIAGSLVGDDRSDVLQYILQGLPDLRRFAESCAEHGDGALRIIS